MTTVGSCGCPFVDLEFPSNEDELNVASSTAAHLAVLLRFVCRNKADVLKPGLQILRLIVQYSSPPFGKDQQFAGNGAEETHRTLRNSCSNRGACVRLSVLHTQLRGHAARGTAVVIDDADDRTRIDSMPLAQWSRPATPCRTRRDSLYVWHPDTSFGASLADRRSGVDRQCHPAFPNTTTKRASSSHEALGPKRSDHAQFIDVAVAFENIHN